MSHEKLAYMANQIGRFFAHQKDDDQAIAAINNHIRQFWDPRMRKQILEELESAALEPRVRRAVEQLKGPA